ncbi:alpha/beta fold hydrolase [Actinoplanes sp. NPDC000266]
MRVLVEGVAGRTVVLFGSDADPDPELTWARGVTLLAGDGADSAPAPTGPVAVVGWSAGGGDALAFAAANAGLVDRVVLVSTPKPAGDDLPFDVGGITAKTLLLFGARDPLTGSRHGTWWQRRLPQARLEMWPDGTHDLLVPAWNRALSHLAPRCRR